MKNKLIIWLLFLMGLAFSGTVEAQVAVERSSEIEKIGGKEYYMHRVKAGQTLYGISEAYNVPIAEIEMMNPDVKKGLKAGLVLGIPVRPVAEPKSRGAKNKNVEHDTIVVVQTDPKQIHINADGTYTVQLKEDLYDIAKKFGIDLKDFREINPGLTDEPEYGTRIHVPAIANENDYIVHTCERNERVTTLLKRWKVNESKFRSINVSVGSHVFVNQVVLMPIQPIRNFDWLESLTQAAVQIEDDLEVDDPLEETTVEVEDNPLPQFFDFEENANEIPQCYADPNNAKQLYHVALMVPLYLYEVNDLEISKESAAKTQKARSLSFIQFYEGFMMAAEALTDQGLKLDLSVFDVTDNVSSAERALRQIEGQDYDLIVGPFFGKSFNVIEAYAKANGITVVNPLSTRESVIENNPNVVKVKPGDMGLIVSLSNLVRNAYFDSNVFIVSKDDVADTAFLAQLEHHLNVAVNDEVTVTSDDFLRFARNESTRLEMGSRLVPTLDVEGQVYSTEDFRSGVRDRVVISNTVKSYSYSEIDQVRSQLSGVRNNLIIAYGDENVFATQMLNTLSTEADRFPITLVCVPDWAKFEMLLVDNLLKMNAIYVSDYFVDYESDAVKRFVKRFRSRYSSEPQKYAFQGYDLAMFFLSALQNYGADDLMRCLHCHQAPMLSTQYRFYYRNYLNKGQQSGKENLYWNLYQYDSQAIELVPINPYQKTNADE